MNSLSEARFCNISRSVERLMRIVRAFLAMAFLVSASCFVLQVVRHTYFVIAH